VNQTSGPRNLNETVLPNLPSIIVTSFKTPRGTTGPNQPRNNRDTKGGVISGTNRGKNVVWKCPMQQSKATDSNQ
jgi:hypothetical protein